MKWHLVQRLVFTLLLTSASWAASPPMAPAVGAADSMMLAFLKQEAVRLDSQFLDGITNRVQWEAQREVLRQEYFEMLGLWPLPERTPLRATVTGTIERDEGFRVEK